MKQKILYLILGILIGATITAGVFLLFGKRNVNSGMMDGQRPNFDSSDMENMPDEMKEKFNDKNMNGENKIVNEIEN